MVLKKLNTKERSLHKCFRFFSVNGRIGTLWAFFFMRFFCLFFAEEPYFFMQKYKHRRDAECYLQMKFLKKS
uniref:Uncharacterized protein n=1 Tax=Siphoviridae sp. ctNLX12 TaxID=2825469 RepID=A0A8S5UDP8_9CAUD|nr:MAG TPA: hypothetical protein [Siphoviridae sp. ctNLX12]